MNGSTVYSNPVAPRVPIRTASQHRWGRITNAGDRHNGESAGHVRWPSFGPGTPMSLIVEHPTEAAAGNLSINVNASVTLTEFINIHPLLFSNGCGADPRGIHRDE